MFRKIHSNRDPRDTLLSELRKEFSVYWLAVGASGKCLMARYPRSLFAAMSLLLLASIVFALFLHHPPPKPRSKQSVSAKPLDDGFSRIRAAGRALGETIRLKKRVDSLLAKPSLSSLDSSGLVRDLDSLRHIRMQLNP